MYFKMHACPELDLPSTLSLTVCNIKKAQATSLPGNMMPLVCQSRCKALREIKLILAKMY